MALKTLLVSEYYPPKVFGGGEISMELIAEGLKKNNVNVTILTSKFKGLAKEEEKNGIKILRLLKTGKTPKSFKENIKRMFLFNKTAEKTLPSIEEDYDLIHFFNSTSLFSVEHTIKPSIAHINSLNIFCPIGTYECGGRCSYSKYKRCLKEKGQVSKQKLGLLKHNPIINYLIYSRYRKRLSKLKKFNKHITISPLMREYLTHHVPPAKIHTIPNPVDLKKFKPKKTKGKTKILYLGAEEKFKGTHILYKALNRLEKKAIQYEFNSYQNQPYHRIPEIIRNHDIIAFPSIWNEPFGRVLIESMACGKPVLAFNVGSVKKILDGSGVIVDDVGNYRKYSIELEKLIKDKQKRKLLGEIGVENAQKYSIDNIGYKTKKVYNTVIK